jgi:hypothetical protein
MAGLEILRKMVWCRHWHHSRSAHEWWLGNRDSFCEKWVYVLRMNFAQNHQVEASHLETFVNNCIIRI